MIFLTRFLLKSVKERQKGKEKAKSPREKENEAGKGKRRKRKQKRGNKENIWVECLLSGIVPPLKKMSVLPLPVTHLYIFTRIWRQH